MGRACAEGEGAMMSLVENDILYFITQEYLFLARDEYKITSKNPSGEPDFCFCIKIDNKEKLINYCAYNPRKKRRDKAYNGELLPVIIVERKPEFSGKNRMKITDTVDEVTCYAGVALDWQLFFFDTNSVVFGIALTGTEVCIVKYERNVGDNNISRKIIHYCNDIRDKEEILDLGSALETVIETTRARFTNKK